METLWQLEANIDDMNPQNMEYVFSQILDKGANDVWAMPMMMKKGRMASMLCVLCRKELLDDMIETIVKETKRSMVWQLRDGKSLRKFAQKRLLKLHGLVGSILPT